MASKSHQDAEQEPPAGAPTDSGAPTDQQEPKAQSPGVFLINSQVAPENLDARTLRLLWRQRELEIKALRWAIQGGQETRSSRILQEVAGFPPESSQNQKFLQDQVHKLTLELREQRKQAQLEREQLEQRLQETIQTLQQLELELQIFQKSCLLRLACSSWVGRVLRSQTGSVEVVTAETLMDPSDSREEMLGSPSEESFQLKDVNWNSVAQRYPNLFTEAEAILKHKQQSFGSKPHMEHRDSHSKSVEWSGLPLLGSNSSGTTNASSKGSQLSVSSLVTKVTRHPSGETDDQQIKGQEATFSADEPPRPEGPQKSLEDAVHQAVLEPDDNKLRRLGCSCLKIVAVSCREKSVCILNQSWEKIADLSGLVLQQLKHNSWVDLYRFPPRTLLAPRHHVTVWGVGINCAKKHLPVFLGRESDHFQSRCCCVRLLMHPSGEVLSENQALDYVRPVSKIFRDNTDLSIDRFPLSETPLDTNTCERRHQTQPLVKGLVRAPGSRGCREGRRRPRWRLPQSTSAPGPASTRTAPGSKLHPCQDSLHPGPKPQFSRSRSSSGACPEPWHPITERLQLSRPLYSTRTQVILPLLTSNKLGGSQEVSAWAKASKEARPGVDKSQARKRHAVQVCCKGVDRSCPMVALSVQSTAENRYGFRYLSCPPITVDTGRRV